MVRRFPLGRRRLHSRCGAPSPCPQITTKRFYFQPAQINNIGEPVLKVRRPSGARARTRAHARVESHASRVTQHACSRAHGRSQLRLREIKRVFRRRYLLRGVGLELFTDDHAGAKARTHTRAHASVAVEGHAGCMTLCAPASTRARRGTVISVAAADAVAAPPSSR